MNFSKWPFVDRSVFIRLVDSHSLTGAINFAVIQAGMQSSGINYDAPNSPPVFANRSPPPVPSAAPPVRSFHQAAHWRGLNNHRPYEPSSIANYLRTTLSARIPKHPLSEQTLTAINSGRLCLPPLFLAATHFRNHLPSNAPLLHFLGAPPPTSSNNRSDFHLACRHSAWPKSALPTSEPHYRAQARVEAMLTFRLTSASAVVNRATDRTPTLTMLCLSLPPSQ